MMSIQWLVTWLKFLVMASWKYYVCMYGIDQGVPLSPTGSLGKFVNLIKSFDSTSERPIQSSSMEHVSHAAMDEHSQVLVVRIQCHTALRIRFTHLAAGKSPSNYYKLLINVQMFMFGPPCQSYNGLPQRARNAHADAESFANRYRPLVPLIHTPEACGIAM
jgi:hypothetical protein